MAREKEFYREVVEHLYTVSGGKIEDSDTGWRTTLKMSRRSFEGRFGRKTGKKRTIYEVAKKLI
jgi:hypothetical protein